MALLPEQELFASAVGYTPATGEELDEPADTSLCFHEVEDRNGWPHVLWKGDWYPVPRVEEVEEWIFDSVCFTPDEDEVEPDAPEGWLSILGLI